MVARFQWWRFDGRVESMAGFGGGSFRCLLGLFGGGFRCLLGLFDSRFR